MQSVGISVHCESKYPIRIYNTFSHVRIRCARGKVFCDGMERSGGIFESRLSIKDFVPELIRRCRKEDLLFPLLDFLVGSVDNISAMEFKRYDSSCYQAARDASVWGKQDPSLEETVNGILKFMQRKGIISVAPREFNAVATVR